MFPGGEPPDLQRVSSFPEAVIELATVWIPLSEGVRLAARVWYPEAAERAPVPAVLEAIPYRRRDGRRVDDEQIHPFFAGHGVAGVRVDLRGSGDSEGLLQDEYLQREQDDTIEVIAWIARQSWCNGCVGMMGLSWGGFAALQVAARRPPALRAVIAVGATVDRYNDDVHYKNGCLLNENFGWASSLLAFSSRPPDPEVVGPGWREMWLERLDALRFLAGPWLGHQLRDAYWRHGSICEDYAAIDVPVMIVTGWSDLYVNAVPRLLENLRGPCHAIAGPWAHQYPHLATPGPAIDFLGEALAWWKRWLKTDATHVPGERRYLAYIPESPSPDPFASSRPGRWVELDRWPSEGAKETVLHLTPDGLRAAPEPVPALSIRSPIDAGTAAGELIPHCVGPELPQDQRSDDGASLIFDSRPLDDSLEIWGDPSLDLCLESDCERGNAIVRLCDVDPTGASVLVSYGVLNLEHRYGNDRLVAMPRDRAEQICIRLNHVAHRFSKGHRIRVAISTAWWPCVWPAAADPKLTLIGAPCHLTLPVVDPHFLPAAKPGPPRAPYASATVSHRSPAHRRDVARRLALRSTSLEIEDDYGESEFIDDGLVIGGIKRERYEIGWDDPLSARAEIRWTQVLARRNWSVRTETRTRLSCSASAYDLEAELAAFEGDQEVRVRRWTATVPRLRGK